MQLKRAQITVFCKAVASGCSPYNALLDLGVTGNLLDTTKDFITSFAAKLAKDNEIEIATLRKRNMLANIDVTTLNTSEMDLQAIKEMLSNFARESESYEVVEGKAIVMNSRKDRLQSLKQLTEIYFKERENENKGGSESGQEYDFLTEEGSENGN